MSYWIKKDKYDVLIKGGGISGVSVAYWLKKTAPNLRVAIYEPLFLGAGATGRNAGFLTCGSLNYFNKLQKDVGINLALEIWNTYKENHERLKEFTFDCDYSPCGATTWAVNDKEKQTLEEIFQRYPELKLSVENNPSFIFGITNSADASVHPLKLLRNIAAQLSEVDFIYGEENLKDIKYDVEVQAKNGYSDNPLIVPQRGQVVLFAADKEVCSTLGYNTENLVYFKQLPTGEVLLGEARTIDEATEQTNSLGENVKIINHLTDFATKYLSIDPSKKITTWSGIMGFTQDHQPIAGELAPNKYILGGFSGHGMGISFMTAKYLVENMVNRKSIPHWMNLSRF